MNEKKMKIIGIVAVLMLLCVACVGAASATNVFSQADLQEIMTHGGTAELVQDLELTSSITVSSNATLELNGRALYRSSSSNAKFSMIIIESDASLTINDKDRKKIHYFTIDGEVPKEKKAGLWQLDDSKVASACKVNGGVITGGVSSSSGAGIYVNSHGTLTINGGNIVGNNADNFSGGGVYNSSGTVNMNGGSIIGNSASTGGGVYTLGSFTMTAGTISENIAKINGDDVYNMAGFTQIGGTIGSSSSSNASSSLMLTAASSEMNDSESVFVCNAGEYTITGGDVHSTVYNNGEIKIGGTAKIDKVYLSEGKSITLLDGNDALKKGAKIGIQLENPDNPGKVFVGYKSEYITEGLIECKNPGYKFASDEYGNPILLDPSERPIFLDKIEKGIVLNNRVVFTDKETKIQFTNVPDRTEITYIDGLGVIKEPVGYDDVLGGFRIVSEDVVELSKGTIYFTATSSYPKGVKLFQKKNLQSDWKELPTYFDGGEKYHADADSFSVFSIVQTDKSGPEPTPNVKSGSSSVASFRGENVGNDFIFENAVVVTRATLPGATSARITNNGSGDGWYKFTLSTDGFTGNGTVYFQVPLDVIQVKGYTINDVSLFGAKTTYLTTDGQYAKYSASVAKDGAYTIGFEKGAASAGTVVTPVTEPTKPVEVSVSLSGVSAMKVGDTTLFSAKNSDGSSAKFAWKSSDNSVATVDENGNVKAVKAGTATITVTNNVTGKTATKTITVAAKAEPTTQQTTKSPFPILGILAGLGIAGVLVMRRKN